MVESAKLEPHRQRRRARLAADFDRCGHHATRAFCKVVQPLRKVAVFDGAIVNGQPVDPAAASRFADVSKLWERDNVTISFSDPEFQACIVCLKHFSDKRSLPGNRYSAELLELFKLTD
jgi:hypothetical protein